MSELEGNPAEVVDEVMDQPGAGSSEGFFEALEKDVNGVIADDDTEATQQSIGPEQVTQSQNVGSNNVIAQGDSENWEKRYKDSSREAVKWRDEYQKVEAFVPILETMKKDSGLVEHVRDYLVNGGKPSKTMQEQIGLDEDFIFDQQEAMTDPKSDSAKLMNAQVDKVVQARVSQILHSEKQNAAKAYKQRNRQQIENEFQEKKGMNDEQFNDFKEKARKHVLTLDDVDYLLNRDQANANVVQHTKTDMLNQMKNVRNIPATASGANSRAQDIDPNNAVFDTILGHDGDLDNLFG